jgi:hypothetical protein
LFFSTFCAHAAEQRYAPRPDRSFPASACQARGPIRT